MRLLDHEQACLFIYSFDRVMTRPRPALEPHDGSNCRQRPWLLSRSVLEHSVGHRLQLLVLVLVLVMVMVLVMVLVLVLLLVDSNSLLLRSSLSWSFTVDSQVTTVWVTRRAFEAVRVEAIGAGLEAFV